MLISVGRRKEAKAKVKLIPGSGKISINGQNSNLYIQQNLVYRSIISRPLENLGLDQEYDMIIHVHGGGLKGQMEAIQLGIARAICKFNSSYKIPLKSRNYLTRDSRSKERRKYGLKKARKAPQFSKR